MHNQESELGKGVQGAKPPAGARGDPASFPFPKGSVDSALSVFGTNELKCESCIIGYKYMSHHVLW
jgi:hypothetical protein